jgi:hypothetical protein
MRSRSVNIMLALILAGIMALADGPPAAAHDPSFVVTNSAYDAHHLVTDGQYIGWKYGATTPSSRVWGLYVASPPDATQVF